MDKKSFLWGLFSGVVLTFVILFVYALVGQASSDRIQYLEHPESYEKKTVTSFKVFQVFDNYALAHEESDSIGNEIIYFGNTVIVLGENLYNDQIVTIEKPQRVGNFSYRNNSGFEFTVPVIDGKYK